MFRPLVALALASSACGSGGSATLHGESNTPNGAADATNSAEDASSSAPCAEAPDAGLLGATCVLQAKGYVEDLAGNPLAGLVMTFCGSQCYGADSNDKGAYTIPIGAFLPTENYAIHADGRPDHAVDYLRLSAGEPEIVSATMRLPTLPPSTVSLPADGVPASTVTVGDLTLLIADGTKFDLDIEDFGTTAGRMLRVASVPLASAPSYAAAAHVDAIYAVAPSGATPSKKMGVLLKNSAALPASSPVELLVLGDDYFSSPPNVGVLAVEATAHVSADGQTIQTDPGEGISELTWLAVRKAN